MDNKISICDQLRILKTFDFRFTFESGVVKIISRCPKWWSLTAMESHFETMPLPTYSSYFAHNLPGSALKTYTIFVLASELVMPWLFFFPHRILRQIVFYWQLYYQCCTILTGNYGLQPFLVLIISLALLDDDFIHGRSVAALAMQCVKIVSIFMAILGICALSLPTICSSCNNAYL